MKFLCRGLIVSLAVLTMNVSQAKPLPRAAKPEDVGFSSQRLQRLTETFTADVNAEKIPGAVILVARKGNVIWGIGDEEYAVRANEKAAVSKEDAVAKVKALLATPTPAAAGSGSAAGSSSAAPAASGSSAPKK